MHEENFWGKLQKSGGNKGFVICAIYSKLVNLHKLDMRKILTPRQFLTILTDVNRETRGERSISMHGRHRKKAPKFLIFRAVTVFVLAIVFSVSSVATVMANTVSANVIDGDKSYTFSMRSPETDEILAQAQELGLEPLGPLDVIEQVGNTTTVNIRRGVSVTVNEAGKKKNIIAFRGDTVAKMLEDNNFLIKQGDTVLPSLETQVTAGLAVDIRRQCDVNVIADGNTTELSIIGGTVAEAIKQAGVILKGKDSANYELDEPLFDKMNIRISRTVKIKITVDGATTEHEVAAVTVRAALDKCGVRVSDDDRLNVDSKSALTDGMEIVVTRVDTKEVVETEEIAYSTEYEYSDELYEGETEVKTAGVNGEKKVTYKLIYIAGELADKEVVSEEIVSEPTAEVVICGTKERAVTTPSYGYTQGGAGTFVDWNGETVSYKSVMSGTCTAYYPWYPNATTSTGAVAGRGCIAVDPNIIPYGTRMYVTSADGSVVYGYGVACDTGGAAMAGDIIADLCYDTLEECSIIGRRDMVIYILN